MKHKRGPTKFARKSAPKRSERARQPQREPYGERARSASKTDRSNAPNTTGRKAQWTKDGGPSERGPSGPRSTQRGPVTRRFDEREPGKRRRDEGSLGNGQAAPGHDRSPPAERGGRRFDQGRPPKSRSGTQGYNDRRPNRFPAENGPEPRKPQPSGPGRTERDADDRRYAGARPGSSRPGDGGSDNRRYPAVRNSSRPSDAKSDDRRYPRSESSRRSEARFNDRGYGKARPAPGRAQNRTERDGDRNTRFANGKRADKRGTGGWLTGDAKTEAPSGRSGEGAPSSGRGSNERYRETRSPFSGRGRSEPTADEPSQTERRPRDRGRNERRANERGYSGRGPDAPRPKRGYSERRPNERAANTRGERQSKDRTQQPQHPAGERPLREDLVIQACLEAYGGIRHESRLADRALEFTLRRKRNLYSQERRAVSERVYALLRRQITIDHLLGEVDPAFSTLSRSQQDSLRFALSRVLHGDSAAQVARSMSLSDEDTRLVERAYAELPNLDALPPTERLALKGSLPSFLANLFFEELQEEAFELMEAMNKRAPLIARVNTLKTSREELIEKLGREGVYARPTELSPFGVLLETRVNAFSMAAFKEGLFELQDEGSQLLGMLADPPPRKVVDACAGAGGKTLQLGAAMKNRGELFAVDVDERRLEDLRRRARRAGVHNARVTPLTSDEVSPLPNLEGLAERVLVDAPCSGTGTFRRKPDARYRLTEDDLALHVVRQKELLDRFCRLVKPKGRLIYGTCSVLRHENEAVVEDFLQRHPEFTLMPIDQVLPPPVSERVNRGGYLRLFPNRHGTDGFFGAVLVRNTPQI